VGWREGQAAAAAGAAARYRRDGERPGRAQADREQDQPPGHLRQAPQRPAQEGLRALRPLRRRGRAHHLLQPRQALRVLQHAEVYPKYVHALRSVRELSLLVLAGPTTPAHGFA
jgi:hypothetical protein